MLFGEMVVQQDNDTDKVYAITEKTPSTLDQNDDGIVEKLNYCVYDVLRDSANDIMLILV